MSHNDINECLYSQYGLEWSLAAVRLGLLHADRLIYCLHLAKKPKISFDSEHKDELTALYYTDTFSTHFYSVEFQIKAVDRLQAFARLDVLGISQHAHVHGDLEVVLLLAHKRVVSQGEVEALVSINAVGWHWSFKDGEERKTWE